MLKDSIIKQFNISRSRNGDMIDFNIRGELDVKGYRDGQLVYHDGGDNTITVWAKHAMMHGLTGDEYTTFGLPGYNKPLNNAQSAGDVTNFGGSTSANHVSASFCNTDGACLSQQQYWWDYASLASLCPQWNTPNASDPSAATLLYSILPNKILFGTGRESNLWANLSTLEQTTLTAQGWTSSTFNANITPTASNNNYYSGTLINGGTYGTFSGAGALSPSRTFNDPLSAKISGTPDPGEYGVQGAVKDGIPGSGSANPSITQANTGVGNPNFLYFQRNFVTRWTTNVNEVYVSLTAGNNYENKVTYSVTMPAQTGSYANYYYPYNGYTLKVAGLFSDSKLAIGNTYVGGGSDPAVLPYTNMPNGLMFAKRYISPITKTADLQLSFQWTLYV